ALRRADATGRPEARHHAVLGAEGGRRGVHGDRLAGPGGLREGEAMSTAPYTFRGETFCPDPRTVYNRLVESAGRPVEDILAEAVEEGGAKARQEMHHAIVAAFGLPENTTEMEAAEVLQGWMAAVKAA